MDYDDDDNDNDDDGNSRMLATSLPLYLSTGHLMSV